MDEWESKKKSSYTKPIFVVCYSRYCPHCSGLPQGTIEYSEGVGNRTDMFVTMLDCAVQQRECSIFGLTGTPHMVLVVGPKRRYWPRIWQKDGNEWNKFIDLYVHPSLREVKTDEELEQAKREPSDGGTTFHLETPNINNKYMAALRDLSKEFRIYNDTFTYRINQDIKEPRFSAFRSPFCETTFSGDVKDLRQFIDKNKFGSLHRYDSDEYKLLRRKKSVMIMVDDELKSGHRFALENIPKDHCDLNFGWISTKQSKKILKSFSLNTTDLPIVVYEDHSSKCRAYSRERAANTVSSGFLTSALSGSICGKTFTKDSSLSATREPTVSRVTGFGITTVYTSLCLMVICIIRVYSGYTSKQE